MTSPRTFVRTWVVAIIGLAVFVVAFNLVVDPYDVFGTPRMRGIDMLKPGPKNHAVMAKTYQEARTHPVTVLIGSSSTHIGIDAAAPQWPAAMRPIYNYGIPGSVTSTSLYTLRESIANGGVRNAVVFLDFQNFLAPERPHDGSEEDRRYHTRPDGSLNPQRRGQVADDMFLSLATMGAFIDSVKTVARQTNPDLLNLASNGSSNEADFIATARADGMHALFAQKDDYDATQAGELAPSMTGWQGELPNLDFVRAIISLAKANHVRLTLAIVPHHADALEIYWRDGLWPRVEQLKAELTDIVDAEHGAVTLWDFVGYSSFDTEAIPAAGDRRTPTSWFWEPNHFKKQLGEVMIQRMFGSDAPAFGALLTPDTIASRNAAVRASRHKLVCEHKGPPLLTALTTPLPDGCLDAGADGGVADTRASK